MFCSQCSANVPEGKRFCTVCGYPVGQITNAVEAGQDVGGADDARQNERLAQLQREQADALQAERERVLESYEASRNVETTPVAQVLDHGRVAYSPLSCASEQASEKDAKVELKEAKAAYKSVRKAAGKSAAPKAIAVIMAIVVAAGVGAGAMWWFSGQQSGPAPAQSAVSSSVSDGSASAEALSEGTSSESVSSNASSSSSASAVALSGDLSSANAQGGIESYVGIWKGDMVEPTHYAFVACCYGAERHPLVLDIKKVSATGRITADARVLFHEHEDLQGADAASAEGDTYLELRNLVGTLSDDGSFSFHDELAERGEYEGVTINVKTVDAPDGTRSLEVTVDSEVLGGHATDFYVLEKQ